MATTPALDTRLRQLAESLPDPVTFDDIVRRLNGTGVRADAVWRWLHDELRTGGIEGVESRRHSRDGLRGARQYRVRRREGAA